MVKKFIAGLLKKKGKEEAKETKEAEDVPEELPPLAEDIIEKGEETKEGGEQSEEAATTADLEQEELPEELPSLDAGGDKEESKDILEDKAELPEEIRKAKAAKAKEEKPAEKSEEKDALENKTKFSEERIKPEQKSEHEVNFFSSILEQIKKHEGFKEKLLAGDLFARMADYWELKKHEIKTGAVLSTEEKLESDLKSRLEQLRILEQKWQVQKLALEEDIKFIHEREREIQTKAEELKRISNELSLFKNVKPEEYFHVYNGVVLKNLHDLIDAFEIVDDETFNHHVSSYKNDFSDWIKNIIKDKNLAEKIRNARAKDEMIEILETAPIVTESLRDWERKQLHPKKYFWLANGVVIKSLYEMSDALKAMGDELFEKHVNGQKNDFSNWVKNALKNEELAERLEKARTKKEMIDILEVFL